MFSINNIQLEIRNVEKKIDHDLYARSLPLPHCVAGNDPLKLTTNFPGSEVPQPPQRLGFHRLGWFDLLGLNGKVAIHISALHDFRFHWDRNSSIWYKYHKTVYCLECMCVCEVYSKWKQVQFLNRIGWLNGPLYAERYASRITTCLITILLEQDRPQSSQRINKKLQCPSLSTKEKDDYIVLCLLFSIGL